jgi:chromate reductase
MKTPLEAIGICGSLRQDSFNRKLVINILNSLKKHGIGTRNLTAEEVSLPFVNEDQENPPAPSVLTFRKTLEAAHIVVIASPEYNGAPSGVLKNAIDWATRQPKNLWEGKIVIIAAASPGALGGARGLIQLRTILSGIKAWVIPEQVQLPLAHQAFAADGQLTNEFTQKQIDTAAVKAIQLCAKLL